MNKKQKNTTFITNANWKQTTNKSSLFRNIKKIQQVRKKTFNNTYPPHQITPEQNVIHFKKLNKEDEQESKNPFQQKVESIIKPQNQNIEDHLKEVNLMNKNKLVKVFKTKPETILKRGEDLAVKDKKATEKKIRQVSQKKILKLNEMIEKLKAENVNLKERLNNYKTSANTKKKVAELEQEIKNQQQIHELQLKQQEQKFNELYLTKLSEKAQQADKLVEAKTQELEAKLTEKIKEIKLYGLEKTAAELIDIVSKFEVVVSHEPDDPNLKSYLQGFVMFKHMFRNFMSQNGIHEIPIQINDIFDPDTMEAFETVQVTDPTLANKVLKILQPGFRLHDRVIKYTLVEVGTYNKQQNN